MPLFFVILCLLTMFGFVKKLFRKEEDLSALSHIEFGRWAERAAERFLRKKKMKLITRNFRCDLGEIDLIMRDGEFIVFIEVKATRSDELDPVTHIDRNKMYRIVRLANVFVTMNNLEDYPARIDVVSVIALKNDDETYRIDIEHEEGVFTHIL